VHSLHAPVLVAIFVASASAIWFAGIYLSRSTDALDARFGLGSALGGLVLLSIATDLPETAITVSAAAGGELGLAVGNLIGGVAIQTLVLAALDASMTGPPLSHRVGSLIVVLEGALVVAVLVIAMMAAQLPSSAQVAGVSPETIAIVVVWLGGLFLVNRARRGLPWRIEAPGAKPGRSMMDRAKGMDPQPHRRSSTPKVIALFGAAALVTLVAGVAIEESGSELAGRIGLGGAVFGATILAACTALPELSTGLASVKLGDHELAFSDIFGGNAFLPVLFLLADAVAGAPALAQARETDLWMAGLGIVLTVVYLVGLLLRPTRTVARLGPDSLAAVALYGLGIAGLIVITAGSG
jgi:cation:H+ antiporter